MRWVFCLQGGWGAQARSSFHSAQGAGRIVRQEREHDQTGDGESGGLTRSGDMGMCASLCPPLGSCWALSGCCLSGLPLPLPTLEAPMAALACGGEKGRGLSRFTIPIHVPCQAATGLRQCWTGPKRGGFPLGNKGKTPQTPFSLP